MGFNIEQYEQAIVNDNGNWSNANGYDKADLNSKIKNAKDTIIDRTGKRNSAQAQYDEANGRNCSAKKSKDNHPDCWKKEADKANRANDIRVYTSEIDTANFNIGAWQNELDIIAEEEANKAEDDKAKLDAKKIADEQAKSLTQNTGGGTNPNTGVGSTPYATKSKTGLYVGVGIGVIVIGLIAFALLTKKK